MPPFVPPGRGHLSVGGPAAIKGERPGHESLVDVAIPQRVQTPKLAAFDPEPSVADQPCQGKAVLRPSVSSTARSVVRRASHASDRMRDLGSQGLIHGSGRPSSMLEICTSLERRLGVRHRCQPDRNSITAAVTTFIIFRDLTGPIYMAL